MSDTDQTRALIAFYDESYSRTGSEAAIYGRWRAVGAVGKADHVVELCNRGGIVPTSTLDIGCGDGALLSELAARGFGGRLYGVEITETAVAIAAGRPGIEAIEIYDGRRLPMGNNAHDLGILSHVLEHVPDPVPLLSEVARVCTAVVVEVPLEQNLLARRAAKRAHAHEIGHLHRLGRASMRAIVARANLRVVGEIEDPLPRAVHRFFAADARAKALGDMKWFTRYALHRASPAIARRLFTVHYACLCRPAAGREFER